MKKISIIVPIYKSAPFLPKLIESVINQTYKNFELILVDDGSPDNSGEICDKYAQIDSRIISLHKENGGCSEARNYGLKFVTGDYLTFIDGDDWYEPDYLEYFVNLMESNNCEMAMSDSLMTTSNRTPHKKDNIRLLTPEEALCSIFYVNVPVGAWNKMYTTNVIKSNSIQFEISWFGEGLYFSAVAAQNSNKIAVGHKKVYGYRKNNPNSGTTVRKVIDGINALEHTYFVKDHITLDSIEIRNSVDWHIWKNNFNLFLFILGNKEKNKYLKEYNQSIKYVRQNGLSVLLRSKVSIKQKLFILMITCFPRITAKMIIKYKKMKLKSDLKKED